MDKKQIVDRIDKLIKEYKEAHLKSKYDDLSDLHNAALIENLEAKALHIIELATEKDSVFQRRAYYKPGVCKRINELIGILYAVKEEILEGGGAEAGQGEEKEYLLMEEKFFCKTKPLRSGKKYNCFIIMPIGKEGTIEHKNNMSVYDNLIKPCVENCGYDVKCYHSDLITKTGDISKQVINALEVDAIVIADLRRNNPNVIYELGLRHAFGKRSILICSKHSENFFHTSKYRIISYKLDGTSNQEFFGKLSGLIEDIINDPDKPDNPVSDILGQTISEKITKRRSGKRLHLSRKMKGTYSLAELYNASDEDLADFDITLEYADKNDRNIVCKGKVIDPSEDPMRAASGDLGLLKKKESTRLVNFPRTKTKVSIKGRVLETGETFSEDFEFASLS